MHQENTPDWKERAHRPYPTVKPRETFSRTLEEHLADTGPHLKKIRLKEILAPEVDADGSPQVLSALSFRRRMMPLAVLALAVLIGAIWLLTPDVQSSPQATVPASSNP